MVNLSKRDQKVFKFLYRQAVDVLPIKSSKITAAIVIKNQIISTGFNQLRTHPFQAKYSKNEDAIFLHAETNAIRNALNHVHPDELKKATLYIQRVKRPEPDHTGVWVSGVAKPCSGCARAIAEFGLKRVVYSLDQGYAIL